MATVTKDNPRVSVVIRCYNEGKHIGRLLDGIAEQTIANQTEIVVVDSGSTDDTLAIAARHDVKLVTIEPEEFSFGRSLNIGVDAASGDYIAIASAHVYPVYRDWLERLVAPMERNERVALVYGKQRGNHVTKFSEHRLFAKWFPDRSNPSQTTPFCNNANSAIRRSLWHDIRYDESLTGLEDLDWARRAIAEGFVLAYSADAEIIHVHEETPRRILNRYRREAIALKNIFPDEGFSFAEFVRLLSANVASDCYHAWHEERLLSQWRDILMFRTMQFWGTFRGFRQHGPVSQQLKHRFYYPTEWDRTQVHSAQRETLRIEYREEA